MHKCISGLCQAQMAVGLSPAGSPLLRLFSVQVMPPVQPHSVSCSKRMDVQELAVMILPQVVSSVTTRVAEIRPPVIHVLTQRLQQRWFLNPLPLQKSRQRQL